MKKIIKLTKMKKILLISLSVFLLALPVFVLAATYVPGQAGTMVNASVVPAAAQKMQGFMTKMQSGTLSSQEQREMYGIMTQGLGMAVSEMPGQFHYKIMGDKAFGDLHKWFGLMVIFTIGLVWVVLLLLIWVLWHQVKKHKHH